MFGWSLAPSDNEADGMPFFQDPFEFRHTVSAWSLEGNLVWNSNDLNRLRITGDFPVRHRNHVIQA